MPDAYSRDIVFRKSILVVDDDASIRGMVRSMLNRAGYDVEEADSGHAAIARLVSKQYDVLILDMMMRDGSGDDVLSAIATHHPGLKCVVVISATSQANIEKIDSANVHAKLQKPFDISELVDAVRSCEPV